MEHLSDRTRNPFGLDPPCERFVPGYGDPNADVHVIGDHPGVHGGAETGIPFTGNTAGERVQSILEAVGLLSSPGEKPDPHSLYLSYRYPCVVEGTPSRSDYADLDPYFDAELRAITAHVLVPVGERAVHHVLETFTTVNPTDNDVADLHATEISGGAWLVVPVADPERWDEGAGDRLRRTLADVLARDYERESDLGRFLTDPDPYRVR
ncbi:MAG: uracil-DNA glycosylase family protein [Halanaeroarchaeum sp.]